MRALDDFPRSRTVAYAPRRPDLNQEMLNFLLTSDRPVTLVVDECDAREHDKIHEDITRDALVTLITIGPSSEYVTESPIIDAGLLSTIEAEEYLRTNHRSVPPEAIPVLAEGCAGNVGHARWLAIKLRESTPQQLSDLISHGNIARFVTSLLPQGGDTFLVAQTLALFERVGWDEDLAHQAETVATFLGLTPTAMTQAVEELERTDVVKRHGRYRSIEPHPLAVLLAAEAWSASTSKIIHDLIPSLDSTMLMSLLRRAADLGSNGPTREVFADFLKRVELLGSLETIESHGLSEYLIQLAIIAPDETARHLRGLIMGTSLDRLRSQTGSRRNVVWSLEKLAWHSRLFESAADCLLRLSLAENETYANNATGTWTALFGAVLPSTGADPSARIAYLVDKSRVSEPEIRRRVVDGLGNALSVHESVARSAEIQGGVFVEARGSVPTAEARQSYQLSVLDVLKSLLTDEAEDVAIARNGCSHQVPSSIPSRSRIE